MAKKLVAEVKVEMDVDENKLPEDHTRIIQELHEDLRNILDHLFVNKAKYVNVDIRLENSK